MEKLTYVHQWWLGALGPGEAVEQQTASYNEIGLHPAARRGLRRQLESAGHLRGGLLFGHITEDTLHVTQISPAGYRWWTPNPLYGDERYALGWIDALVACTPHDVDWVGSWLAAPNNAPFRPPTSDWWIRQAAETGAVDHLHPC